VAAADFEAAAGLSVVFCEATEAAAEAGWFAVVEELGMSEKEDLS